MSSLRCPWAENHINVSPSGNISMCCLAIPIIDKQLDQPYNIKTHNISRAFNSAEFETIRTNLRNGIEDKNCTQCWDVEKLNGRSIRHGGIDDHEDRNISPIDSKLLHMNLSLSNQCNLKCRTCGPSDSSAWIEEYKTIYVAKADKSVYKLFNKNIFLEQDFFKDLEENIIPTINHLHFMGGEPFLIKQQWQILDSIIKLGYNQSMTVSYHTNGTIWNDDIADTLSKFKNVEIALSIDDIGQRFEYIRHPAKWHSVKENLLAIKKWVNDEPESRSFGINCTVSIYNIFTIKEILDFCNNENIVIFLHPTGWPNHFSIFNLPDEIKSKLLECLNFKINDQINIEIANLISMISQSATDHTQWPIFLSTTDIHDSYRKEDWKHTFPELFEVVKSYV